MTFVSDEEEKSAFYAISESFSNQVSREEIFRVESSVWKLKFRPHPLPYVAMSVEEARSVTDLSQWTNSQVRVIGMMTHDVVPWLISVGEEGGESRIALDLTVVACEPPFERLIQVFGILEIEPTTGIPQLQVWFYRYLETEHLIRYRKALEAQRSHVPTFVKKRSRREKKLRNESESSVEMDPETALLIHHCCLDSGTAKEHLGGSV